MTQASDRLAWILDLHFHPRWGARFWLERARHLGFDPRREIRTVADLERLGPMPLAELGRRPVTDFVPRALHGRLADLVTSETGGTTGPPGRTAFTRAEFEEAFVLPFLRAARRVGFPRDRHWLFVGPSGPHAIGKAARECAVRMGSMDPFAVDFDPRWARRLPPGSLARRRYTEHVLEQARAVLETQDVGVLFATPPILAALGERLPTPRREAVAGVHLGGMAPEPGFWRRLASDWFPNAVVLAGYGNSLAGLCPQLVLDPEAPPEYFPHGSRLRLEVVEPEAGGRGRVRFHRLDESCLLVGVLERDEAEAVPPPPSAEADGFASPGLRDPRPPAEREDLRGGLY